MMEAVVGAVVLMAQLIVHIDLMQEVKCDLIARDPKFDSDAYNVI